MSGAAFHAGSSKQDYGTPADFMAAVTERFGPIHFDLAAHTRNTKAKRFFTVHENALSKNWGNVVLGQAPANLWLNPPFANISPWAKKCRETSTIRARILFLVPAAVGSNWFAKYVHRHALVLVLNGRLTFDGTPINPKTGKVDPYPKDCMLCVFGEKPGFDIWRWRHR
jgi:phage N-6-adenine-methyltransferase